MTAVASMPVGRLSRATAGAAECTTRLHDGPLVCIVSGPHAGHVFQAGSGSWVDDRHDDGGHG